MSGAGPDADDADSVSDGTELVYQMVPNSARTAAEAGSRSRRCRLGILGGRLPCIALRGSPRGRIGLTDLVISLVLVVNYLQGSISAP